MTPFFPSPTNWRGAYCLDFAKALERKLKSEERRTKGEAWQICVFVPNVGGDYEIDEVKVYTFRERRLPSNIFPNLFVQANQKAFLSAVERAGIRLEDVAVCHGNTANFGIYPLVVKKRNPKCKTLLHHHDLASFGLNMGALRHCWLYNMIQFPILRRMHEAIDTHVFISEASRSSFLSAPDASWTVYEDYRRQMRGLPYRPARIRDSVVLHNGVDMRTFHKEPDRRRSMGEVDRTTFIIGCISNFIDLKDQETLIRAVGLLVEKGLPSKVGEPIEKIKVVFIENYGVSLAELIIPAADISEQISTAGKEASGTSNMKLMMNGAITMGTLDGANIEIVDLAGRENAIIFGLTNEEAEEIYHERIYSPWDMYNSDWRIKKVMDSLFTGSWTNYHQDKFRMIFDEIMNNNDTYLVLKDFASYVEAQEKAQELFQDKEKWNRMSLMNIANSGFFSSDRTIEGYVKDIWHLEKVA